jgi:hypothetical protein
VIPTQPKKKKKKKNGLRVGEKKKSLLLRILLLRIYERRLDLLLDQRADPSRKPPFLISSSEVLLEQDFSLDPIIFSALLPL